MNITTAILSRHLAKHHTLHLSHSTNKASFCSFRFYDSGRMKPEILYIMRASHFAYLESFRKECAYLVIGVTDVTDYNRFFDDPNGPDLILLEGDVELTTLSNQLNDIFDLFEQWEDAIGSSKPTMEGLQHMIDCSDRLLHGSVILADYRFNYVAYSDSWADEINMIRSQNMGRIPAYIADELLTNPEYLKVQNSVDMFEYPIHSHNSTVPAYCLNLFRPGEHEYRARILYVPNLHPAHPADLEFLEIFRKKLNSLYNQLSDYSMPFISFHELRSAIKNGILRKPISEDLLSSTLHFVDWKLKDKYQLLSFTPYFFENTKEINAVMQHNIELLIPHSCTILHEKHIVVVVNLTRSMRDAIDSDVLASFIRDHLYKVGASAVFDSFAALHQAYRESIIALEQGNRRDSTFWFYNFSDYALPYIIERSQEEISKRHLCIPGLIALQEYDEIHKSDYVRTLKEYVDCRYNVTHTAEKMFLHRTTLLKHLKKIQEISKMDLEDWNTRLHLGLSLQMMFRL